jgi:hypothetical protein
MNPSFELIFLLVYFCGRLFFYNIDSSSNAVKRNDIIKRLLFGIFIFFISGNLFEAMIMWLVYVLAVFFDSYVVSKKKNRKLAIYVSHILFAVFISQLAGGLIDFEKIFLYNPIMFPIKWLGSHLLFLQNISSGENFVSILKIFTGFIFTIKEGTLITRLVLRNVSATPKKKENSGSLDRQEYDRGKLIGILERGLIYFLIIFNQVAAIAIIIALKSLARFKELDDKNFAEYFLIGSLLSICVAVLPAVIVKIF